MRLEQSKENIASLYIEAAAINPLRPTGSMGAPGRPHCFKASSLLNWSEYNIIILK